MHVFDAAEVAVDGSRENDDGNVGTTAAEESGYFGAELAGSEVVVEDGDVDVVEEVGGLFDSGGGNGFVAVLAQDGGAKVEIGGLVIKQ